MNFQEAFKLAEELIPIDMPSTVKDVHPHTFLSEIFLLIWGEYKETITYSTASKILSKFYKTEEKYIALAEEVLKDHDLEEIYKSENNRNNLFDQIETIKKIKSQRVKLNERKLKDFAQEGYINKLKRNYFDKINSENIEELTPRFAIMLLAEYASWLSGIEPKRKVYSPTHPDTVIKPELEGKSYGEFKNFAEPIWEKIYIKIGRSPPSFDLQHKEFAKAGYPKAEFRAFLANKYPH
jgi:hypothetical protein